MILHVKPTPSLHGVLHLPASKSYSIRAFIIAACGGVSQIIAPSDCDDADVALSVARHLGTQVSHHKNSSDWILQAGKKSVSVARVNVRESGTALRFLLPLLSLQGKEARVEGEGTLRGRPNFHLTQVLRQQGVAISGEGPKESIPIHLRGGTLHGGRIEIDGTLSSQFISALLIACPRLPADTVVVVKGPQVVSQDYITMTLQVLKKAGIKIDQVSSRIYKIPGRQRFKGLKRFVVPSDYGLAAFLMAAGILLKSDLVLQGHLKDDLIQADGNILGFLQKMGVRYKRSARALTVKGPYALKGGSFSLKDCPDLVPVMAVLALFAGGKTRLCNIRHARAKESDRISDLRRELVKVGARVTEKDNELIIDPSPEAYKNNVSLDPHHDHRLAMAFAVLGLRLGASIKDIECVSKSYPGFVKDLRTLGADVVLS